LARQGWARGAGFKGVGPPTCNAALSGGVKGRLVLARWGSDTRCARELITVKGARSFGTRRSSRGGVGRGSWPFRTHRRGALQPSSGSDRRRGRPAEARGGDARHASRGSRAPSLGVPSGSRAPQGARDPRCSRVGSSHDPQGFHADGLQFEGLLAPRLRGDRRLVGCACARVLAAEIDRRCSGPEKRATNPQKEASRVNGGLASTLRSSPPSSRGSGGESKCA
jgi:hypothetical protein